MKNFNFIVITLLAVMFSACQRVPAGYKGLKVRILGGDKGDIKEVGVGLHALSLGIEYYLFPTFNQNAVWTASKDEASEKDESFTFSISGMPVNVDLGIQYSLIDGKIADLFVKYRKGVDEITDIVIRNMVRDLLNKYSSSFEMDTLMSGGMTTLLNEVEKELKVIFINDGINIISLSLVNAPRYPQSIVQAIEEKNKATQRAIQRENELREIEAEAKKKIEQARGEYESAKFQGMANRELAQSYSQTLINKLWIEKWNGVLPTTQAGTSALLVTPK